MKISASRISSPLKENKMMRGNVLQKFKRKSIIIFHWSNKNHTIMPIDTEKALGGEVRKQS